MISMFKINIFDRVNRKPGDVVFSICSSIIFILWIANMPMKFVDISISNSLYKEEIISFYINFALVEMLVMLFISDYVVRWGAEEIRNKFFERKTENSIKDILWIVVGYSIFYIIVFIPLYMPFILLGIIKIVNILVLVLWYLIIILATLSVKLFLDLNLKNRLGANLIYYGVKFIIFLSAVFVTYSIITIQLT